MCQILMALAEWFIAISASVDCHFNSIVHSSYLVRSRYRILADTVDAI